MNPILVGVDFSRESDLAIAHAIELARHVGASVTLALVTYVPEPPEGLPSSMAATYARYATTLKEQLASERERLAQLRERFSGQGVELSQVVLDGRPEDQLPSAAREISAAMIVVGTHGRTGFRRLALGSVAEKVVRRAECAVLVARGLAPRGGYHRVAVGLDFSPSSRLAVQAAKQYLAPGGHLDLVHCWQLPAWSYAAASPMQADNLQRLHGDMLGSIDELGKKWLAEVGGVDGEVAFHRLERSPAAGLDAWATENQTDLLVVGSHGYRGLQRWLIGSVAEATVRHAPCSVVVVHGGKS
jgi:nucleotide-binding universal stress UspA family protein